MIDYNTQAKLPLWFYQQQDVLGIAQALLGKHLVTHINGQLTAGMIVETEAYTQDEKACHAYGGKRTSRTEAMFKSGGRAYVYLCYGIHHLFNIVTYKEGVAHAILIRAVEPVQGIETMLSRRKMDELKPRITAGPGTMSQAMGITTALNDQLLTGSSIWLTEGEPVAKEDIIIKSPRVGVNYAGADALLPWRFRVKNNPYTSPAK